MVQSRLEPSVEYPNVKHLDESDKDKLSDIYLTTTFSVSKSYLYLRPAFFFHFVLS